MRKIHRGSSPAEGQVIVDALPPQQIRAVQRQAGAGKPGSALKPLCVPVALLLV